MTPYLKQDKMQAVFVQEYMAILFIKQSISKNINVHKLRGIHIITVVFLYFYVMI